MSRISPRLRRPWLLIVGLLLVTLVCTALGVWQVQRRAWKLDLIQRIEDRVHQPAMAAPGPNAWPTFTPQGNEYRRVTAQGTFLHEQEVQSLAVTGQGRGYWVVTPLQTDGGFTVLVNRGFVPTERRAPATRPAGQVSGTAIVTGLLRLSEPAGGFLQTNNPAENRWYSRDVAAIARKRNLGTVAPYFIDADATPNPGGLPLGGLTVIAFHNNHLSYLLTWFTLAAMSLITALALLWLSQTRR